jgi:hypothetical protein
MHTGWWGGESSKEDMERIKKVKLILKEGPKLDFFMDYYHYSLFAVRFFVPSMYVLLHMCSLLIQLAFLLVSQLLHNLATTETIGLEVFPLSKWLYLLLVDFFNIINITAN